MWTAPLSDSSDDNHPMALRCRERAPSTRSLADIRAVASNETIEWGAHDKEAIDNMWFSD